MTTSNEAAVRSEDVYDWTVDLHQRLVAAKPEHTARGLLLSGITEALRTLVGEEAVRPCLEKAGVTRVRGFQRYPIAMHLKLAYAAAEALSPNCGGFDEALRHLGRWTTMGVLASLAGRTMRRLTGGQPRAMVNVLPRAYWALLRYGERTVTWTGPASGRLTILRDFLPWPYHEGVLLAVLEASAAHAPRVHTHRRALCEGDYAFSWMG